MFVSTPVHSGFEPVCRPVTSWHGVERDPHGLAFHMCRTALIILSQRVRTNVCVVHSFLAVLLAACRGRETLVSMKEYVPIASLENETPSFLRLSDGIIGVVNPKPYAEAGQTISVTLIDGSDGRQQIIFPDLKIKTAAVAEKRRKYIRDL